MTSCAPSSCRRARRGRSASVPTSRSATATATSSCAPSAWSTAGWPPRCSAVPVPVVDGHRRVRPRRRPRARPAGDLIVADETARRGAAGGVGRCDPRARRHPAPAAAHRRRPRGRAGLHRSSPRCRGGGCARRGRPRRRRRPARLATAQGLAAAVASNSPVAVRNAKRAHAARVRAGTSRPRSRSRTAPGAPRLSPATAPRACGPSRRSGPRAGRAGPSGCAAAGTEYEYPVGVVLRPVPGPCRADAVGALPRSETAGVHRSDRSRTRGGGVRTSAPGSGRLCFEVVSPRRGSARRRGRAAGRLLASRVPRPAGARRGSTAPAAGPAPAGDRPTRAAGWPRARPARPAAARPRRPRRGRDPRGR